MRFEVPEELKITYYHFNHRGLEIRLGDVGFKMKDTV